jgi:hypothetical protein
MDHLLDCGGDEQDGGLKLFPGFWLQQLIE